MPTADTLIRLAPDDANARWGPALLEATRRAALQTERRLGVALRGPVTVRTYPNSFAFQRALGAELTHVVAAARADRNDILILRPAFFGQSPDAQQRTLIHELTHLVLGRQVHGPLPTWLNEGLAMIASGEGGGADRLRLTAAGAFHSLIPLAQLENSVLLSGERQSLAYAQSLSLTRFYLELAYPDQPDNRVDPAPLVRELTDPIAGPRLTERLWEPLFRRSFEIQWRRRHQSVWNWIAFLSGSAFLWLFTTLLFLLVYWRKQRMSRIKRECFDDDLDDGIAPAEPLESWLEDDETDSFDSGGPRR